MKEKLIIKNFGPIKEVDLDLGRFTILIGEQATGKSTVAKVLAMCRYFSYIVGDLGTYPPDNFESSFFQGLIIWGLSKYVNERSYIFYSCNHYSVTIDTPTPIMHRVISPVIADYTEAFILKPKIEPKSAEFKDLLSQLDNIRPKYKKNNSPNAVAIPIWTIPYGFFQNDVKNVMDNPFYLPTGRGLQSVFSLGQASIPNLANFLYNYFSKVDGILRSFNKETEIEPFDIVYKNVNGIGFIKKKNEKDFYLLSNAASGYQSTIPVVLVMKYYNEIRKRKKAFLIEEPELNLFPSAQTKVVEYLAEKTVNSGNSILLTTHSPYILASINNLIYAFNIGQMNDIAVNNVIDRKYWLDPSEVSAYKLLPDGKCENIIDADLNEILVEELDGAGKDINAIYDKILDIKFKKHEESNDHLHCREYNKVVSRATATENGLTFELINDSGFEISKWRIDDCILKAEDGSKCDYLLVIKEKSICYWVELKDQGFDEACKQIYHSIKNIKESTDYKVHHARVITGRFIEDRNRIDEIRYVNQKKLINLIGKERLGYKTKIITENI